MLETVSASAFFGIVMLLSIVTLHVSADVQLSSRDEYTIRAAQAPRSYIHNFLLFNEHFPSLSSDFRLLFYNAMSPLLMLLAVVRTPRKSHSKRDIASGVRRQAELLSNLYGLKPGRAYRKATTGS